jgi:hypothetical protein
LGVLQNQLPPKTLSDMNEIFLTALAEQSSDSAFAGTSRRQFSPKRRRAPVSTLLRRGKPLDAAVRNCLKACPPGL